MRADEIETRAAPLRTLSNLVSLRALRGIRIGGAAGALSGLASFLSVCEPFISIDPARAFGWPSFWPALCLGTAFGFLFIDMRKKPSMALLAVVLTYIAWYAAWYAATTVAGNPYKVEPNLLQAGLAGGAVGSLGMIVTAWALIPRTRDPRRLGLCLVTGTLAGVSTCLMRYDKMIYDAGTALMFAIWQASMLASLMAVHASAATPRSTTGDGTS